MTPAAANESDFPRALRAHEILRATGAMLVAMAAPALVVFALHSSAYAKSIVAALLKRAIDIHLN